MLKFAKYCFVAAFAWASVQCYAEGSAELKTDKERLSYTIGASIGKNFKKERTDVDLDLMIKGLKASLAGEKLALPDKEMRQILGAYQVELRQQSMKNRQLALLDNKKKGEEFLAENKIKKGVVTLESGIQYKIIKQGHGNKPAESDTVEVNYRGTLVDGTEFDATESGHPASLKASALISGWKQVLKLMPVGSKWEIAIPSQLGYGERGVGSDIGPNEVLLFDLELLAIKE
jgi:FKBP-type peptidyl-prolyl cis-trans isomerase FklB